MKTRRSLISTSGAFALVAAMCAAACDAVIGLDDIEVDPGRVCFAGDTEPCFSGDQALEGQGECRAGERTCKEDGTGFGECEGEILPATEDCTTAADEDCDGLTPPCECEAPPCECETPPCDVCEGLECGTHIAFFDAFGTGMFDVAATDSALWVGAAVTGTGDFAGTPYVSNEKIMIGGYDYAGNRVSAIRNPDPENRYDDVVLASRDDALAVAWDGVGFQPTNDHGRVQVQTFFGANAADPQNPRISSLSNLTPNTGPRTALAIEDDSIFVAMSGESGLTDNETSHSGGTAILALIDSNDMVDESKPDLQWIFELTTFNGSSSAGSLARLGDGRLVAATCVDGSFSSFSDCEEPTQMDEVPRVVLNVLGSDGSCGVQVEVPIDGSSPATSCDAKLAGRDDGFLLGLSTEIEIELGDTPDAPRGGKDAVVTLFDVLGEPVETRRFGAAGDEVVADIVVRPDGSFVVGVIFDEGFALERWTLERTVVGEALALVEIVDGEVVDVRVLEGVDGSSPLQLAALPDGRLAIAGRYTSALVYQPSGQTFVPDTSYGFVMVESIGPLPEP